MTHSSKQKASYSWRLVCAAVAALGLVGCGPVSDSGEPGFNLGEVGTTEELITNPRPWAEAPDFVRNSLVIVYTPVGLCSGTIVASNRVLTAEHCVVATNPTGHSVQFANGTRVTVSSIKRNTAADIAVLFIPGIPSTSGQVPVRVHTAITGSLQPGNRVIIAGAGKTSNTATDAGTRRWGKTVYREYLGNYTLAGGYSYSSGLRFSPDACVGTDPACSNVCQGDSGGPVYQWRSADGWGVIGVNSGSTCSSAGAFMIAGDARAWRDWILN